LSTDVESFFDPATFTLTHLVTDPTSKTCAVIDPVLDYDPKSGRTSTDGADKVIARIRERGLTLGWVLETHVHADHLSGAQHITAALGGRIGIGANVTNVQKTFIDIYNLTDVAPDGSVFDHLFEDGETIEIGALKGHVMFTPGHTPACITYVIGDAAFIGDTLFSPDYGTARCDFPGGDGAVLWDSMQKILALPDATRLFLCHDYLPNGRALMTHTTVAQQRAENIHLLVAADGESYAKMRAARDAGLSMPVLILPSVQVNVRAGQLPPAEANGVSYLKLPVNRL
jgi:glyoxylase-like metal-dependent hydrolase (beta-lactamase superfamily II)